MKTEKLKSVKRCIAGMAAAAAVLGLGCQQSVQAQGMIDLTKESSLELEIPKDSVYFEDAVRPDIQAKIYRIADVSENGEFTLTDDYGIDLKDIGTAGGPDWEEAAKTVEAHIKDARVQKILTLEKGESAAADVVPGMYLVSVESAESKTYQYEAEPFLTAIPAQTADGEWLYDVTCEVKLGRNAIKETPAVPVKQPTAATTVKAPRTVQTGDSILYIAGASCIVLAAGILTVCIARKKLHRHTD